MSLLSVLKTIGSDIDVGIQVAGPVIGTFVPAAGPILTEVGTIISALETAGKTPTAQQTSQVVQTIAAANAIKQSVSATSTT